MRTETHGELGYLWKERCGCGLPAIYAVGWWRVFKALPLDGKDHVFDVIEALCESSQRNEVPSASDCARTCYATDIASS